ncbi:MAG: DUF4097 domain-containing protein [Clostridiales bacterium]|nr:DUF4097 domain-containing protein [Clostridiales bacterium]
MDEKMMILKMLEEGKINSEEAIKLLESLERTDHSGYKASKNSKDEQTDSTTKFNDTINKFSKKAEEFADKFGPDFVEKVENISNDFANAAVKFADKIVSYINSTFNNTDIYKTLDKQYCFPVKENTKFVIRTQNIAIKTHETNKSEIIMDFKLKFLFENTDIDELITLKDENGVIYFNTNFPIRTWGALEIYIPKNINVVDIQTSNSKCCLNNFLGDTLNCTTSNGKIEITSCNTRSLIARTNNGKIKTEDSKSNEAEFFTSNSSIEFNKSCFDKLKSFTSNGSINLNNFDSIEEVEAKYLLQTSNGKVSIGLSKNNNSSCKIYASTSLGNINISKLDSSYLIDKDKGNIQAEAIIQSKDYDTSEKRIYIEASTSNSSIYIIGD